MAPFARQAWEFKRRTALALARHHDSGAVQRLVALASSVHRAAENDSADFVHNGEARVLGILATAAPVTVLDVGAHHGGWAREVLTRFPAGELLFTRDLLLMWTAVLLATWALVRALITSRWTRWTV